MQVANRGVVAPCAGIPVAPTPPTRSTSAASPSSLPAEQEDAVPSQQPISVVGTGVRGPQSPQPGIAPVPKGDRLPRRASTSPATLWWLGVHGGAGETTLSALVTGSRAADHAWPVPALQGSPASPVGELAGESVAQRVVLVARSHARGLLAAQRAAMDWASGGVPGIELVGLVVVADAPGRPPKALRDLADLVAGGVPRAWWVPWVEAWRLGQAPAQGRLPRRVRALASDLARLVPSGSTGAGEDAGTPDTGLPSAVGGG